jgi:hypothetical protein
MQCNAMQSKILLLPWILQQQQQGNNTLLFFVSVVSPLSFLLRFLVAFIKAKKGGLSRDEEDIEYIALSFPTLNWMQQTYITNQPLPQIIFKQSKQTVEADHDMTGSTAKVQIPKARLCHGQQQQELVIRTEWSDVHVYSLAPWVRQLIRSRRNLSSLQEDLMPLLIARQHRGKRATFGKAGLEALAESIKENQQEENLNAGDNNKNTSSSPSSSLAGDSPISDDPQGDNSDQHDGLDDKPYSVQALLLPSKLALRSNTIPAYLFACKEAVAAANQSMLPEGSRWNSKFQTLILEGTTLGAKINMKSSTVGKHCQLGDKCRLHNVVIMDGASIGEGCSLQNTIVGHGAQIGNNCSLNDCQVGPGMVIPPSTKEKGESFMVGDVMDSNDILL